MKILIIFEVSHFEIMGIDVNESQLVNILLISVTLEIFHFEISGIVFNE